jgi:ferritin
MQIGSKMADAMNAQIGREFFAALQYVAMSAWFEEKALPGFAGFFAKQAAEENEHALKLVRYLGEVGAHVTIPSIEAPRHDWTTVEAVIRTFLEAELEVTSRIHALVDLSLAEKDHSSFQFLQWYVEEQREEVSSAQSVLDRVRRIGEERVALLDASMGAA